MSDGTKIEWADATVNAINGCSVVSPGCTNCYAMRLAGTRLRHHPSRAGLTIDTKAGPVWNGKVRLNEDQLMQPLRWKRPRRIFWNAHGDTFHDAVPDEWIDRIFAICALTPQHTHMILTKRSARMREYLCTRGGDWMIRWPDANPPGSLPISRHEQRLAMRGKGWPDAIPRPTFPLPNVWLGVSAEDQTRADERIPDLLATPAAVRFISAEPLLEPIDLRRWLPPSDETILADTCDDCGDRHYGRCDEAAIDLVIVGGEGGPDARPMHPEAARSIRDQCAASGTAFFFKQWGEWAPIDEHTPDGVPITFLLPNGDRCIHANAATTPMVRVGKKNAGRLLDGRTHDEWPA